MLSRYRKVCCVFLSVYSAAFTHIPHHFSAFSWWFLVSEKDKNMYMLKNLITYSKKECRKCKWDVNRSKWSGTVHDRAAEPPTLSTSKQTLGIFTKTSNSSTRWACDSREKCTFKSLREDVDALHRGRRIILMDTNCQRANPRAVPPRERRGQRETSLLLLLQDQVSCWVYAAFTWRQTRRKWCVYAV